jgi:hypothetical protein
MADSGEPLFEKPDYASIQSPDEIEPIVSQYKDRIVAQVREQQSIEAQKAQAMGEYNAELKAVQKGLDHYLGVLDQLEDCRKHLIDKARQPDLPFEDPLADELAARRGAAAPATETPPANLVIGPEELRDIPLADAPPPDDGSIPLNDDEIGLIAEGHGEDAAALYAERVGCTEVVALAEVQAYRAAQQPPAEPDPAADPPPPTREPAPKRGRRARSA